MHTAITLLALLLFATQVQAQDKPEAPKPKVEQPSKSLRIFEAALVASTVVDIEGTQHCIAEHMCREANPLMGSSRAQQYSVGLGLDALAILASEKLARMGQKDGATFLLWFGTTVHLTFGIEGFRERKRR